MADCATATSARGNAPSPAATVSATTLPAEMVSRFARNPAGFLIIVSTDMMFALREEDTRANRRGHAGVICEFTTKRRLFLVEAKSGPMSEFALQVEVHDDTIIVMDPSHAVLRDLLEALGPRGTARAWSSAPNPLPPQTDQGSRFNSPQRTEAADAKARDWIGFIVNCRGSAVIAKASVLKRLPSSKPRSMRLDAVVASSVDCDQEATRTALADAIVYFASEGETRS